MHRHGIRWLPDLVMTLIWPPLYSPYSASKLLVMMRNSAIASRFGMIAGAGIDVLFDVAAVHAEVVGKLALPIDRDRAGIEGARRIEHGCAHILHCGRSDRCLPGPRPAAERADRYSCGHRAEQRSSAGR